MTIHSSFMLTTHNVIAARDAVRLSACRAARPDSASTFEKINPQAVACALH